MSKRITLSLLFVCMLLLMVCIEAAAGSSDTKDEISISAISGNMEILKDDELNESEKIILNMLTGNVQIKDTRQFAEDNEYAVYIKYLHNYLGSPGVTLSSSKAYEVLNKIIELNAIMDIEQEISFSKMSVDGKELAINLSKEIYDVCGLKLTYDIQGNINQIIDKSGRFIYLSEITVQDAGIRLDALMITLAVIMILLGLCIIIARKNQLFMKDVILDEFKEEGFVQ